jgi:hypothetical protein
MAVASSGNGPPAEITTKSIAADEEFAWIRY